MSRAHSFPQKILPNSAGKFAKFRGLLQQNRPNSAADHDFLFASRLSYILFRNFCYWRLSSVNVISYASNIQKIINFFLLKVQSVKLRWACFIRFCHIAMAISKAHNFRQFS